MEFISEYPKALVKSFYYQILLEGKLETRIKKIKFCLHSTG